MTHKERVLELLSDGQPHTHHELYALHVIGHSRVADLRRDGHQIDQWRDGDDYLYRLVSRAEPQPPSLPTGVDSCGSTGETAVPSAQPTTAGEDHPLASPPGRRMGVGYADGNGQLALLAPENGAYRRAA